MERESLWWALLFFTFTAVLIFAHDWQTIVFAGTCATISLCLGIASEIERDL